MVIYKSEVKRAVELWKVGAKRWAKINKSNYRPPNFNNEFLKEICKRVGVPTSEKYIKAIRPILVEIRSKGEL